MSRYFQPQEFACQCGRATCDAVKVSDGLLLRLDDIRALVNQALYINSGVRCRYQNDRTPGAVGDSEHTLGLGADIRCEDSALRYKIVKAAFDSRFTRIGIGRNFVHLGISMQHDNFVIWHYYPKDKH
jgi:zinc D-Ala-D-Ala carboxypeptidase